MRRAAPLALLLPCAFAAACRPNTFVFVNLLAGSPAPGALQHIDLDLQLSGRSATERLVEPSGGDIVLPTTATVQVTSGSGLLTAAAFGFDATDTQVAAGEQSVTVVKGTVKHVDILLVAGAMISLDGGTPDLASAGSTPDLASGGGTPDLASGGGTPDLAHGILACTPQGTCADCNTGCTVDTANRCDGTCTGAINCNYTVGPGSCLVCAPGSSCVVTCTGACTVTCQSATCFLKCPGQSVGQPIFGGGSC